MGANLISDKLRNQQQDTLKDCKMYYKENIKFQKIRL